VPALALFLILPAFASAASLDQVLASMDRAAASFRGMSANLRQSTYTAIIKDTSEETGSIRMQRSEKSGVRLRIDFKEPDVRTVTLAGKTAEVYYPNIRTVHVYDLGKHRQLVDQFLLLGFGTPGSELQRGYDVKLVGEESIAGQSTARLELRPKSPAMREHLTKVDLWLSASGHPVQQKFYKPSGDYTLVVYSDLAINPPFGKDALAQTLPPGVKREFPQK
jgi:outer membrane lipoprotein-sorting protein